MAVFPRVRTYKGVARKVWIAKWKDRGGRWRQKEFARKKAAEHHERAMIREVDLGIHVPDRQTRTFGEACQAWLEDNDRRWRIGDRMSGNCLMYYRLGARDALTELGGLPLNRLTHPLLQEIVDKKSGEVSHRVLDRMTKVIGLVLRFALRRGWLGRSPLEGTPLRRPLGDERRVVPPSLEDIHRILAVVERRPEGWWRAVHETRATIVLLALYTGMRCGEVVGLQWENVDFEAGEIRVRHSLSVYDGLKPPKTRAGLRNVPMPLPLMEALLRYAAARPRTGYVVTTHGGGKPISPNRVARVDWPAVLGAAGLLTEDGRPRYGFHSLRHAYVSLLLAKGVPLWHISKLVGHSSTAITEKVYGHLLAVDDTRRRAADSLGQLIDQNRQPEPLPPPRALEQVVKREEQRATAQALWKQGHPQGAIAGQLNVSERTIRRWLKGAPPAPKPRPAVPSGPRA